MGTDCINICCKDPPKKKKNSDFGLFQDNSQSYKAQYVSFMNIDLGKWLIIYVCLFFMVIAVLAVCTLLRDLKRASKSFFYSLTKCMVDYDSCQVGKFTLCYKLLVEIIIKVQSLWHSMVCQN